MTDSILLLFFASVFFGSPFVFFLVRKPGLDVLAPYALYWGVMLPAFALDDQAEDSFGAIFWLLAGTVYITCMLALFALVRLMRRFMAEPDDSKGSGESGDPGNPTPPA